MAFKLYSYSAIQGFGGGQANLAEAYEKGLGVESNNMLAYAWYELAVRSGWAEALQGASRLAKSLTADEISTALSIVNQWKRPATAPDESNDDIDSRPLGLTSTGTAFLINARGHFLTNKHVIAGCAQMWVKGDSGRHQVFVVAEDDGHDLAVVAGMQRGPSALPLSTEGGELGDQILVAGYPLPGLLSSSIHISSGIISSTAGLRGDESHIEINAPLQPGNSGGPVLDHSGSVVGIFVGSLNATYIAEKSGKLPQNVNFAIKASVARKLLDRVGIEYRLSESAGNITARDAARTASRAVVLVECWR